MEMEWNSNGNIPVTKSIRLCIGNGNGVDKKKDNKFDIMDMLSEKQNGISVEWYWKRYGKINKIKIRRNGMELEWNWNGIGMERL